MGLESLATFDGLMALLTLTVLEIVLGIDNLVFLSIIVGKVEKEKQRQARILGLGLALFFRVVLLLAITWIIGLDKDVFTIVGHGFSWKDIILVIGGLFLIAKSTMEIREKLEMSEGHAKENKQGAVVKSFMGVIIQIVAIDLVFSLDSILTAVGLTKDITIMIVAIVIAMAFMMIFAKMVGKFINENPTIIMLALSFLIMIGTLLILEAFGEHVPRGYIYFAMGFSFFVELLNLKVIKKLRAKR